MEQVDWQRRRDILICIIGAGIIIWVSWLLVNQFVDAIFILLVSMAIAFLITPFVNTLVKLHLPRVVASIIAYVIVLVVLVGLSYAMIFSLVSQAQSLTTTIVNYATNTPQNLSAFLKFLVAHGVAQDSINTVLNQIRDQATSFARTAVFSVPTILIFITNTFLNFLILMVISFYLTLDGKRIRNSIFSIIPKRSMPHALLFEDSLNRVVGNYIRGQLTLAVIIGVATSLVCLVFGLPQFAIVFGVLGFLFETIPMVGPGLASISPLLVSLLLPDPFPRTLIILISFIVIQLFESNVLGPRIVGHAVGLHPVASIMALLVFAQLFGSAFGAFGGAIGALVATPIVAAAWVVIASIYRSARGETPDQILARKRAPWTMQRPTMPSSLRFSPVGNRGGMPRSAGTRGARGARPKSAPLEQADQTNLFPNIEVKPAPPSLEDTREDTRDSLAEAGSTENHE